MIQSTETSLTAKVPTDRNGQNEVVDQEKKERMGKRGKGEENVRG